MYSTKDIPHNIRRVLTNDMTGIVNQTILHTEGVYSHNDFVALIVKQVE